MRAQSNQFTGSLFPASPPPFTYLKLASFNVQGNNLSGSIPTSYTSSLPLLTVLTLSDNLLDGPLPATIGDLGQLSTINLNNNSFDGALPDSVGASEKRHEWAPLL